MAQIGFDRGLVVSRDGVFKILEFALSIVILVIISTTRYWIFAGFQSVATVAFTGGFCSGTLFISLVIYLFKLYNIPLISKLPWKLMEMIYNGFCALLYFISMAISAWAANEGSSSYQSSYTASAIMCTFAMLLFLLHLFLIFRSGAVRSEQPSRSETTVNT